MNVGCLRFTRIRFGTNVKVCTKLPLVNQLCNIDYRKASYGANTAAICIKIFALNILWKNLYSSEFSHVCRSCILWSFLYKYSLKNTKLILHAFSFLSSTSAISSFLFVTLWKITYEMGFFNTQYWQFFFAISLKNVHIFGCRCCNRSWM